MTDAIMPFGKYKDRPITDALADGKYVQWLVCQPWFRDRYESLYVVITQGAQDSDTPTPEHNALQARFVDAHYRTRVWAVLLKVDALQVPLGFPDWTAALAAYDALLRPALTRDIDWASYDEHKRTSALVRTQAVLQTGVGAEFESGGWDVVLDPIGASPFVLELKPSIGDEYPSVVRTVQKRRNCGQRAIAFDRWVATQPLATVQAMFPEIIWLDLGALE